MKKWMYKWLPIIFGCHCKDSRSFHTRSGVKYPICARCTGELIGMIFSILSCFFFRAPWQITICLMIPMLVDGFVQQLTRYESNNFKRVITGMLFGYAIVNIFVLTNMWFFRLGQEFAIKYMG